MIDPRLIDEDDLQAIRRVALSGHGSGDKVILRLLDYIDLLSEGMVDLMERVPIQDL